MSCTIDLAPVISLINPNVRTKHSQGCCMLSMMFSQMFRSRKYWEHFRIGWGNSSQIACSYTNYLAWVG